MSGGQWMVVLIVAIVMVTTLLKTRHRQRGGDIAESPPESADTVRLREEVARLKERLQVLERIATEKENSLAREIDELRDR